MTTLVSTSLGTKRSQSLIGTQCLKIIKYIAKLRNLCKRESNENYLLPFHSTKANTKDHKGLLLLDKNSKSRKKDSIVNSNTI